MAHLFFSTRFGSCGIAWNETGLTGFALPRDNSEPMQRKVSGEFSGEAFSGRTPVWVTRIIERVQSHFEGDLQDFSGTVFDWSCVSEFQRAVYLQTLDIKPGCKTSYGEIAALMALGRESARAVGAALAANPWPLIVPCHRVVSAGGRMTGFSAPGGIRTKTRLLALEGAELISE